MRSRETNDTIRDKGDSATTSDFIKPMETDEIQRDFRLISLKKPNGDSETTGDS